MVYLTMALNADIKPFLKFLFARSPTFIFLCEFYYVFLKGQVTSHEEVYLSFLLYIKSERSGSQHA